MNSRLLYIVLGILVLLAVIVRIASPPPPAPPGPIGNMPNWKSHAKLGDMGPWAVNPSGSMWAGAWNLKTESGKLRSAVWVINFEKGEAKSFPLKDGLAAHALTWRTRHTLWVAAADKLDQLAPKTWIGLMVDAEKSVIGEVSDVDISRKVLRIVNWPASADPFIGQIDEAGDTLKLALVPVEPKETMSGGVDTKLPKDARLGTMAAVDPESGTFVFGVVEDEIGSNVSYYLADTKTGTVKRIFGSEGLPGRVEGLWLSPAGVMIVTSGRDVFHELVLDPATGKMNQVGKAGFKTDVKKNWPDAPADMKFVSYTAGYRCNLATGKTKKLFEFNKRDRSGDYWQREVQDGRLYPRKDGGYTSVSYNAGAIDIRNISKDGSSAEPLLPRQ
ncbi:MAG: hypothetical protein M1133_01495 [Armatimonadetes bacterium]|nr:hypothetical protein [Armatimonadota bacterium]